MQIGEQLKEAREQKNLTLDDIQAATKIQKRYLVAIEQEDFHALPGRFYARAFIKEYANAVKLDPEVLLASFDEDNIKLEDEEEAISYSRLKRTGNKGSGKGASILSYLPSVIVVLLIASILIVAWTLYQKSLSEPTGDKVEEHESDEIIQREPGGSTPIVEDDDEEDESDENELDDQDTDQESEDESGTFTVTEEGTGNSPESAVSYAYEGDTLKVTLEATEDTYVQVKDESGTTHLDRLFTSGMTEELELSVQNPIYFNIGHTPGMTIHINNDLLEYPISTEQSVHQKIWLTIN